MPTRCHKQTVRSFLTLSWLPTRLVRKRSLEWQPSASRRGQDEAIPNTQLRAVETTKIAHLCDGCLG